MFASARRSRRRRTFQILSATLRGISEQIFNRVEASAYSPRPSARCLECVAYSGFCLVFLSPANDRASHHKIARQSATHAQCWIVEEAMRDNSAVRGRVEPTESLFPDNEAPSFCARPTPLLPPPSSEGHDFDNEPITQLSSSTHVIRARSSRPMLGPAELLPPFCTPAQAVDVVNDMLAKRRVRARATLPSIQDIPNLQNIPSIEDLQSAPTAQNSAPHPKAITIEAPSPPRWNARRVIARGASLLMVGVLLGFVGYVFGPRLVSGWHELEARITVPTATR